MRKQIQIHKQARRMNQSRSEQALYVYMYAYVQV
jgi:hypothetical protein